MTPIQKTPYLFVYGSLRRGFKSDAYGYISQFFNYVGDARARGYLYDNGIYPVAKPSTKDHYLVGELYVVKDPDLYNYAMMQLDDYEGVYADEGETPKYERVCTPVYFDDKELEAWVYWFKGDVDKLTLIESGDMLDYIQSKSH